MSVSPSSTEARGDASAIAAAPHRLSAVDAVRARILLALRLGLISAGQRLAPAATLASGLNVSGITARRALESLVEDGVLIRRPGRGGGTFVSDTPAEVEDASVASLKSSINHVRRLIDRRVLMESAIVAAAMRNITPQVLRRLDHWAHLNDTATTWEQFHEADEGLHRTIADCSGLEEVGTYRADYDELVSFFLPYPIDRLQGSAQDHRDLVAAIHDGATELAVEITRRHVGRLRHDMFIGLEWET